MLLAAGISSGVSTYLAAIFSLILYAVIPRARERRPFRDAKFIAVLIASTTVLMLLFYDKPLSSVSLDAGLEMSARAAAVFLCTIAAVGSLRPLDARYLLYRAGSIRLGNLMSLSLVQLRRLQRNTRLIFYAMKLKGYFRLRTVLSSLLVFLRTTLTIAVVEAEEISVSLASKRVDMDRPMVAEVVLPWDWRDAAALISATTCLAAVLVI